MFLWVKIIISDLKKALFFRFEDWHDLAVFCVAKVDNQTTTKDWREHFKVYVYDTDHGSDVYINCNFDYTQVMYRHQYFTFRDVLKDIGALKALIFPLISSIFVFFIVNEL